MRFWQFKRRDNLLMWLVTFLFISVGLSAQTPDGTDLKVAGIFGDHMVLQQNLRIPIWGWATPGEKVTVQIKAITKTGITDKNGRWEIIMPPFPASDEGFTININSGSQNCVFSDVLFGDVWICAGQSNMQFALKGAEKGEEAISNSADTGLRLFTAEGRMAWCPAEHLIGKWEPANPSSTELFSAVGYFFGKKLRQELDVPIGLIDLAAGGTVVEAWIGRKEILQSKDSIITAVLDTILTLEQNYPNYTSNGFAQDWDGAHRSYFQAMGQFRRNERNNKPELPQFPDPRKIATFWYHGTVNPLIPFGIKGVIWYQGESNAHSVKQAVIYENLFSYLIQSWRYAWGQGDFPFLFVQLPPFDNHDQEAWIKLRQSQLRTEETVPNTAMLVTTDIYGEKRENIHPKQKKTIGDRLGRAALGLVYGKQIAFSAPKIRIGSVRKNGNILSIGFSNLSDGLYAPGDSVKGFEIAGTDNKYVLAKCKINGDRVEIWQEGAAKIQKVRYNWKAWPDGNLFNTEGLPVAPFEFEFEVNNKK